MVFPPKFVSSMSIFLDTYCVAYLIAEGEFIEPQVMLASLS